MGGGEKAKHHTATLKHDDNCTRRSRIFSLCSVFFIVETVMQITHRESKLYNSIYRCGFWPKNRRTESSVPEPPRAHARTHVYYVSQ